MDGRNWSAVQRGTLVASEGRGRPPWGEGTLVVAEGWVGALVAERMDPHRPPRCWGALASSAKKEVVWGEMAWSQKP